MYASEHKDDELPETAVSASASEIPDADVVMDVRPLVYEVVRQLRPGQLVDDQTLLKPEELVAIFQRAYGKCAAASTDLTEMSVGQAIEIIKLELDDELPEPDVAVA